MQTALAAGEERIRLARAYLREGRPVPADLVDDSLVRSWERSVRHRIDPSDKILFGSEAISTTRVRELRDQRRDLIDALRPELEILSGILTDSNWIILCADADGLVVEAIDSSGRAPLELRAALQPGRSLQEAAIGTTAPGFVLVDHQASLVQRSEHFLDEMGSFVCAAVPIFAADGSLAGVLDITSQGTVPQPAILEALSLAARGTENRLLIGDGRRGRAISLHHDPRLIGSPLEGILMLSDDDRVIGANRVARTLLSLNQASHAQVDLAYLFDDPAGLQRRFSNPRVSVDVSRYARNGTRIYLRSRPSVTTATNNPRRTNNVDEAAQESQTRALPFVCSDVQVRARFEKARRAFLHDLPVVVQGETGTGKEVIARALHDARRGAGPFVAVNCSAMPEGLIESELFGYVDGAFTGGRRGGAIGKVEQAQGGTLFLDEIGDMPPSLQTRLLRVLQDRTVTRVGGVQAIAVDLSIICATHRDLAQLVSRQAFREDLYYRLCGSSITLAPLRNRSDLGELIDFFLDQEAQRGHRVQLTSEVRRVLLDHRWPGNIRQLQQTLRASVAATDGDLIDLQHLPDELLDAASLSKQPASVAANGSATTPSQQLALERIRQTLTAHAGNISATARALGISRGTLYKRIEQLEAAGTA